MIKYREYTGELRLYNHVKSQYLNELTCSQASVSPHLRVSTVHSYYEISLSRHPRRPDGPGSFHLHGAQPRGGHQRAAAGHIGEVS